MVLGSVACKNLIAAQHPKAPATMDCQDWEAVTVRRRSAAAHHPSAAAGTRALRTVESEEYKLPTKSLSAESRAEIVRLRTSRVPKLTQAELNTLCSFPPNTIRDIESGRVCPSPTQLNVLNRVLRTTLKYA